MVMASNFVLPEKFPSVHTSHWIMFFQKGYIQENSGNAIFLV